MADFFVRRLSVSERVRGGERRGPSPPCHSRNRRRAGRPGKSAAQLVPDRLEKNESGVPMLKVYDVKNEKLETLSVEDYLPAVLAGEMAGDWPLEALKAQAILARTSCCNSSPKRNPCTTARISPPTSKKRRRMTRRA